jgi:murein DD-endopeptidase MepM/ murein hydrolase activator NlpD
MLNKPLTCTIATMLLALSATDPAAASGKSAKTAVPVINEVKIFIPSFHLRIKSVLNVEKPEFNREIPEIPDTIRDESMFTEYPDDYDIWSDSSINPYKVDLTNMADTVVLNLNGFRSPLNFRKVTSDFGLRRGGKHYGIDLKLDKGDSVTSAFDGVIRITKRVRGYGNLILVKHGNGLETLYAHLSKILVNPGDTVSAGTLIGLGGSTGRSTGPHLHFETRYLGNVINPNDLIDFENSRVKNSIYQLSAKTFDYKKEFDKIRYWKIRSGQTLGHISLRTGVSVSKLCALNGITRKTVLRIGRNIRYN